MTSWDQNALTARRLSSRRLLSNNNTTTKLLMPTSDLALLVICTGYVQHSRNHVDLFKVSSPPPLYYQHHHYYTIPIHPIIPVLFQRSYSYLTIYLNDERFLKYSNLSLPPFSNDVDCKGQNETVDPIFELPVAILISDED